MSLSARWHTNPAGNTFELRNSATNGAEHDGRVPGERADCLSQKMPGISLERTLLLYSK
jgi:hypothetical protein